MKSFFKVKTVQEVLDLLGQFDPLPPETIALEEGNGRTLADDCLAREDIPGFERSTMDGFAVRAKDTFGASESMPALFTLIGEVSMGEAPRFEIGPGQAARIWTGGMLPSGADAVVMIEYARRVDEETVELARPAAPFENVVRRGEDVSQGQVLLQQGLRLRPQDLGLLAALGLELVTVTRRPCVGIISTGDEVVPVTARPGPGQIRDVNTYTLGALVESAGAEKVNLGLVGDSREALRRAVERGLAEADVILLSGGSSVGMRDFTLEVLQSFPGSEILVHGVSVSPGKPTIMAKLGNQSLWGLPGHTVSAMITCDIFIRPLLQRLSGEKPRPAWGRTVPAVLSRNVPSVHGRQDFVRVRLENGREGLTAHPILGQSGLISTMVKADGLISIGLHEEGLPQGAGVEVILFE